jgi:uncharacterized protein (DUF305 family)
MPRLNPFLALTAIPTLLFTTACGGSDQAAAGDTAGASAAVAAGGDTGTSRPQAGDADREFLRMMTDHHEGLVVMASAAMNKATRPETQGDAHKLHTKQAEERDRMVGMIRSMYSESHTPTVTPENRAMNDSLQQKSGAAYDRDFYRNVIAHHRQAIQMVDQFLPRLTRPEVRQMAQKMREDQTREIAEFERKTRA